MKPLPPRDPDVEAALRRLRQDLYRDTYYPSTPADAVEGADAAGTARRSGWVSMHAQGRAYAALRRALPAQAAGHVLDLGCGDGALLRWLVEQSKGALTPHGIDFLPESIEAARAAAAPEHRPHFQVADANDFDTTQRYDLVLTSLCYVLPPARAAFAARCRGWLRPGGQLVLYEYRGSPLFEDLFHITATLGLAVAARVRDGDVALVTMAAPAGPAPAGGSPPGWPPAQRSP